MSIFTDGVQHRDPLAPVRVWLALHGDDICCGEACMVSRVGLQVRVHCEVCHGLTTMAPEVIRHAGLDVSSLAAESLLDGWRR